MGVTAGGLTLVGVYRVPLTHEVSSRGGACARLRESSSLITQDREPNTADFSLF